MMFGEHTSSFRTIVFYHLLVLQRREAKILELPRVSWVKCNTASYFMMKDIQWMSSGSVCYLHTIVQIILYSAICLKSLPSCKLWSPWSLFRWRS